MIKVQNNNPTREPIPAFLRGLAPESLADLSWTDPELGVSDCKWLPEVDQSPALGQFERYGAETLTVGDGVVQVTRAVVSWPQAEIDAAKAQQVERVKSEIVAVVQQRLTDFAASRGYSSLEATSKYKDITDAEIDSLPAADRPLVTKFRTECRYIALATAQTWAVLYRGLAEVQAGTRPMPTDYDAIRDELPALVWPV